MLGCEVAGLRLEHLRTIVGLRPYRKNGFRLEAEQRDDKLIAHNYGHGGCGVTLSWGTAEIAVELALQSEHRSAAVIGCGAVGLATARLLQERGFRVTIYARDLPPDTTSNVAGALWTPVTLAEPEHATPRFRDLLIRASRSAHRKFESLIGARYGVRWLPTYWVSAKCVVLPWELELTPELVILSEAKDLSMTYRMMMIEPSIYLAALLEDFRAAGGEVITRDVHDFAELPERLIINCSGIGAKALTGDEMLVPIKGQIEVLAPQPEIDFGFISCDEDLYMLPRSDGIVLGGSHRHDDWSLEANAEDTRRILDGHGRLRYDFRRRPERSEGSQAT